MGDDEIRTLLAGLPPAVTNRPPGMVRVFCEAVEERGADLRAVERWVRRKGGFTGTMLRTGPAHRARRPAASYLAIPMNALRDGRGV
jgi:hypothetical protein